jgi:hypothetical protein
MTDHINCQIHKPHLVHNNTLHVVGVISNSPRYHSRYRLFREWMKEMEATPNVKLYVVELAFGDRHHEVTESVCPNHLQLRTNHEIWHKENMINLAAQWLFPHNWKYMAWIDGDVSFRNPMWAQETLHQLQHYQVVQPWSQALDLGPMGNIMQVHNSFGFVHSAGFKMSASWKKEYHYGHSGFAWACTRKFWENLPNKGLMDFAILGSADHHMAWAMVGKVDESLPGHISCGYRRLCKEWERDAVHVTRKRVGFVQGRIEHSFHGSKKKRYYKERWQILKDHHYDPEIDLAYDNQGLTYLLCKPDLEHQIHKYFRARQEDSIDE